MVTIVAREKSHTLETVVLDRAFMSHQSSKQVSVGRSSTAIAKDNSSQFGYEL
jgi:hypothetical protein